MGMTSVGAVVLALVLWLSTPAVAGPPPAGQTEPAPPSIGAVLDRYCITCHNSRLRTADLALDEVGDVRDDAAVWEQVLLKLRSRTMPPPRRPRPDAATYDAVASLVEIELDRAARASPQPGRPAPHRLNRAEYANAIRDLLAVEIDSRSLLPADDQAFGFDNIGDVLTLSPRLLERYLSAARTISRVAVGSSGITSDVAIYPVSRYLVQADRMSDALPFGTRGGAAIRHQFPLDGEYVLRIELYSNGAGVRGEQLDVRLDGERVGLMTIGQPVDPDEPNTRRSARRTPIEPLEVRVAVKAGPRVVGVALPRRRLAPEGVAPDGLPVGSISFRSSGVASIEIEGPFQAQGATESASRRRLFVCDPATPGDEEPCARRIMSTVARRAYRRPVTDSDLEPLMRLYEDGRSTGDFSTGIQRALERVLVDPEYLFRVERDPVDVPQGGVYPLSDLELASRLSFFLWSSVPDEELLDLGTAGRLGDPVVLEQQVRRLLADPRASALVENFASQWLYLRNLRAVTPDLREFPEFDDNLREAFERETTLFVESQLREDRGITELLTADYTFVNERLARHYGIPHVYGSHFRRVPIASLTNDARRGLLGHGSILTVTSYATRTSPVVRGKWLLENILGTPPPSPPANVPPLPEAEDDVAVAALSMRERMEQHRVNPVCASCHTQMDPLGFALENFDAIGKWRSTTAAQKPIDTTGTLPDGTPFRDAVELRQVLADRGDEFVTIVTSKLLTYALGRGVEYYDKPVIRQIVREAAPDHRWSSIILGITRSMPFQMRMRRSEP